MATPARHPVVIRFGAFELDAADGELRKSGILLKLHPQPLRVLLLLAERPGQIVTREEIRRCLWGDNTFVDFERGINFCVNQIRSVMGDDVEHPRYIETLPRRGYRFIASVTIGESTKQVLPFHLPGSSAESKVSPLEGEEPGSTHEIRIPRSRLFPILVDRWSRKTVAAVILASCVIAVLIAGIFTYTRRPPKLTEKDSIVLADFTNTTGDAVFDDALKQALAVELGQSPFLNILSETKASETLKMMGRPLNARVTPDIARELCLRTGSKAVLSGAISSLGSHYLVDVDAVACSNGDTLAREQFDPASKEDVLKALSRAAANLRTKLGESLPSVQKFDVPIEATTNSLEALKNYSMGAKVASEQGDAPSIPFLKRAIELDPNFPMAYAALGAHYSNLNEPSLALEYATKAYQLRDRVTEREKFRISFIYLRVSGEVEKQAQLFQMWMADYPHDAAPHISLGMNFFFMGQYEKALGEWQRGMELGSENVSVYEDLGNLYVAMNRPDAAREILNRAQTNRLDSGDLHLVAYRLAFLQRDLTQMEQQVAWATGKPGTEDILLSAQSDTEGYYGRLGNARKFSSRAVDSAVRADAKEAAALWRATAALREAEFGEREAAQNEAREALALATGRNVKIFAALALARAGESAQARTISTELEKSQTSNTVLKLYRLPAINAAIALGNRNPTEALEMLEIAKPYDLGEPTPSSLGTLYPPYLRGDAYLLLRNGAAAAGEFQKVVDHPGIGLNSPLAALAHLQLGRAHAIAGDEGKARAAYQDFFELWKDADGGIPIQRQAKAEYAKLK